MAIIFLPKTQTLKQMISAVGNPAISKLLADILWPLDHLFYDVEGEDISDEVNFKEERKNLIAWLFRLIKNLQFSKKENSQKIANATRVLNKLFSKSYFNNIEWEDQINGGQELRCHIVTFENFKILFQSLVAEVYPTIPL